jgi:prepilin signal peptidase PulO-like enzyme (type II secretory pathway)
VLEIGVAVLFVLSYLYWPFALLSYLELTIVLFGLWLVAVVLMTLLLVYDLRWMLLPDKVVAMLFGVSLAYIGVREAFLGFDIVSIWQIVGSVAITSGLFWLLYQFSDGRWIGGGDVKLGVPLGIFIAEPIRAALMLFLASVLGSVVGVALMTRSGKSGSLKIPFGPFLIVATVIVVLFGDGIIDWYLGIALGT